MFPGKHINSRSFIFSLPVSLYVYKHTSQMSCIYWVYEAPHDLVTAYLFHIFCPLHGVTLHLCFCSSPLWPVKFIHIFEDSGQIPEKDLDRTIRKQWNKILNFLDKCSWWNIIKLMAKMKLKDYSQLWTNLSWLGIYTYLWLTKDLQ